MTKIVFYGANDKDKQFFEKALGDASRDISFVPSPIDLQTLSPDTEIISVFIDTPVTREIIQQLPNLKLITSRSTGLNHIDVDAAKERNITVANVPAYGGSTVAEYSFTLLLMLTRHMTAIISESMSSAPDREHERGMDLHGKTIGIIGTGNIGRGVASIAKGFGMEVIGYDVYPNKEQAAAIGFEYVEIDELLSRSDIVSLHIPYMPENHHFLNQEKFGKLKRGAIVINTARGELIDTTALVGAVHSGQVGAAGLDVVENEHLLNPEEFIKLAIDDKTSEETLRHAVSLTALQRMPNVLISNHNAFNSQEAVHTINQATVDNILKFRHSTG